MLINELSKRTAVSIPTLRYYENYGLFKGVSNEKVKTNNYKDYDESIVEKIEMIKGAKGGGFTLSEIKKLLDSKISQLNKVRKLLSECIADIEKGGC